MSINPKFLFLFVYLSIASCNPRQDAMKTPVNAIDQFEKFRSKEKFHEDMSLFYPGIADPKLKTILTEKINKVAKDFKAVAESDNPTGQKYQGKIKIGLNSFSKIYLDLDTEDRERICTYFEEIMDIVGLESSDGQLNKFMYGFDPS